MSDESIGVAGAPGTEAWLEPHSRRPARGFGVGLAEPGATGESQFPAGPKDAEQACAIAHAPIPERGTE